MSCPVTCIGSFCVDSRYYLLSGLMFEAIGGLLGFGVFGIKNWIVNKLKLAETKKEEAKRECDKTYPKIERISKEIFSASESLIKWIIYSKVVVNTKRGIWVYHLYISYQSYKASIIYAYWYMRVKVTSFLSNHLVFIGSIVFLIGVVLQGYAYLFQC